jgi:hypothetical protein
MDASKTLGGENKALYDKLVLLQPGVLSARATRCGIPH